MAQVPRLVDLCLATIADELLQRDSDHDIFSVIFELPSELFDALLPLLPPFALQELQRNLPVNFRDNFECAYDDNRGCRKRKRYNTLDRAWLAVYKARWPVNGERRQGVAWLDKHEENYESISEWQQMYWEAHLQECVDAVAETALLPSYNGSIGEIQISDDILGHIGFKGHLTKLTHNYDLFSYHCKQFGVYVRHLRLPNALCTAEICELLQNSKLISLELQWIKYIDQVEGLCKLLSQNADTLKSVEFIHCKLSFAFINAICDSLIMEGLQAHGVEHFSIKRSSFFQPHTSNVPDKLVSFLTTGRSFHSLI